MHITILCFNNIACTLNTAVQKIAQLLGMHTQTQPECQYPHTHTGRDMATLYSVSPYVVGDIIP